MKWNLIQNIRGFTLIEAMVTVGVAGVAILGLSQMIVLGLSGSSKTHSAIAFQSLVSQVRVDMLSNLACANSFLGKAPTVAGTPITTIFMPDGVTPLITSAGGATYGSISKIKILLYDLGPIDTLPQSSIIHIVGINISGTQQKGTSGSPQPVASTVYAHVILSGAGTVMACSDGNPIYFTERVVLPTGTNLGPTGVWIVKRGGDTAVPVVPRPGTLEVAYGTGPLIASAPCTVNPPFGVVPAANGAFFYKCTANTWVGIAYKLW